MSVKFLFFLILITAVSISINGLSQVAGCTDPQALNYNAWATINDGSCLYPPTTITPVTVASPLPQEVIETSGLIYWNGGVWTQNDSGNEPELYKLDTITGQILQTVTVTGAENVDWEDLAQDSLYIYIGDFGNNEGNRTDLKIYKTAKASFPVSGNGAVTAVSINFSYADQLSFEKRNRSNDYDCEALITFGDSLYIFTKNWANEHTRLYAMPKSPGTYSISPVSEFNTDGLVTGADILDGGSELVLCGYKDYNPFIWLLFDFQETAFFNGNKRRINFSGNFGTQTEGISYTFGRNVYISSEKTAIGPARLFRINTSPWTVVSAVGTKDVSPDRHGLLLFPNPNDGNFLLDPGFFCEKGEYLADVIDCQGNRVIGGYPVNLSGFAVDIHLPGLNEGFYLLKLYSGKQIYTNRLLVAR